MDPRRLREETRAEHEATESLMPLTGASLTLPLYLRTLEVLQPLVASWEQWTAEVAPPDLAPLVAPRRRSEWLREDLRVLRGACQAAIVADAGERVDWAQVVGAPGSQAFRASFLGGLYVMEGSTLGGRYIARHVESVLGMEPGKGDAYFRGHGEATGAMWREVTREIEGVPEAEASQVIGAARRVFVAFGEALRAGLDVTEALHG